MKILRHYTAYLFWILSFLVFGTMLCPGDDTSAAPFAIGETIRYTIHISGVKVGIQTVKLVSRESLEGRSVYRISGKMKTTGILNLLHQRTEQWEVLVDSSSLYPVRIERNIYDRGAQSSYIYYIHQEQRKVIIIDRITGQEKVIQTDNFVFDQFSLCYFYRKNPWYFKGNATFDFLKKESVETIILREEGLVQVNIPKLSGSDTTPSFMFIEDGDEGIEIYTGVDSFSIPLKIVFRTPLSDKKKKVVISLLISDYAVATDEQSVPEQYRLLLNKNILKDI
jgi:hypothetical protein